METGVVLDRESLVGLTSSFGLETRIREPGPDGVLMIRGSLSFEDTADLWRQLQPHEAAFEPPAKLNIDVSQLTHVDGGSMALLVHLRARLQQRGVACEIVGGTSNVEEVVRLYGGHVRVKRPKRRRARGALEQLGRAVVNVLAELKLVLSFFGQLLYGMGHVMRRPRSANWKDVPFLMERAGADAVPVVLLINLLVGLVMAFQASRQLMQFGANLLVADLIGISVTRELGPLITSIVVAGRSGAAFAAELGSMKVNEEIDALRTMGFGAMRYLVIPRVLALMVVLPLLSLLADVVGIAGGMIVGTTTLDLSSSAYLHETQRAVTLWDVTSGALKAIPFGMAIGLIACQQGLATEGGAEGVGRRTTSAVVITLFALIVLDALFTIFFRAVGL